MKKEYIIGGLALLGVIGVVSYLRKPKRNSEGFFNAQGRVCVRREVDGSTTQYTAQGGSRPCPYGGRVVRN
jgi:hypothetical protein